MSLIDVGAATDLLDLLSARYPLDLGRLVAIGHSAGGHLALWTAARHRLASGAPGSDPVVRVGSVLVLAGISDLREGFRQGTCDHAVYELLGGPPDSLPDRYAHASPAELLPLGVLRCWSTAATTKTSIRRSPTCMRSGHAHWEIKYPKYDSMVLIISM